MKHYHTTQSNMHTVELHLQSLDSALSALWRERQTPVSRFQKVGILRPSKWTLEPNFRVPLLMQGWSSGSSRNLEPPPDLIDDGCDFRLA